jgi:hypothetical protein
MYKYICARQWNYRQARNCIISERNKKTNKNAALTRLTNAYLKTLAVNKFAAVFNKEGISKTRKVLRILVRKPLKIYDVRKGDTVAHMFLDKIAAQYSTMAAF